VTESNSEVRLTFHEVAGDRWAAFERLFEAKGGPNACWYMVWRASRSGTNTPTALRLLGVSRDIENRAMRGGGELSSEQRNKVRNGVRLKRK
jgi:hypothetical protein